MSDSDHQNEVFKDCLKKQLEEIVLIMSIFCSPGEVALKDPAAICHFNDFIEGKIKELVVQLDFSIFMTLQDEKIEIFFTLPHTYPILEIPEVLIKSNTSKAVEKSFKNKLNSFIDSVDKSEPYLYQIILWIQENLEELSNPVQENNTEKHIHDENEIVELERLWIVSHHIKSKWKRQEIIKTANDFELTGFCRPGKPGVICVEGLKKNTQEFWRIIKLLRWQKITMKKSEIKMKVASEIEKFRRFQGFKEELRTDEGDQMDMGLFMKFLEQHNSSYVKMDLFGL